MVVDAPRLAVRRRRLARLALALLVLVAELSGRSLTHRLDVGRHVRVSYHDAAYYPVLNGAVKIGVALMLARIAWRFFGARRVASLLGAAPRLRLELSWRLWLGSFVGTTGVYLMQTNAERAVLHSSALPVFALLAVFVAAVYRSAERFLGEYERIAATALAVVQRVASHRPTLDRPHTSVAMRPAASSGSSSSRARRRCRRAEGWKRSAAKPPPPGQKTAACGGVAQTERRDQEALHERGDRAPIT